MSRSGSIDPITLSVLWSAFVSIADDMGAVLRRTAYSAAVREGDDFSTGLFDAQARLIAQGNFSPGHLGAMPYVVQHVLEHYPVESLAPGDCVLLNDSLLGSGHYPDCFLTSPLFVEQRLVGFAVNCAHHVDMGGAVPGSQIVSVKEAFQEGLRILPIKLVEGGKVREDVLRLILGNVRLPEIVRGDLLAQRNTNEVAARRVDTLVAKYGFETVEATIDSVINHSETHMRNLIRALPDGSYAYEDCMDEGDTDAPLIFRVRVEVDGDDIRIDWSESDDQVMAGINSYINYTRAYSAFAVKAFTDPGLPLNHGANLPIEVVARLGSFFNPTYPAPSSGRATVQVRLFEVICGALSRIVPDRAMASFSHWSNPIIGGQDRGSGEPFVFYDLIYGGYGGGACQDGAESMCPVFNATNIPVEIHEHQAPIRIQRMELVCDSGGAGQYRGGSALRKDFELLAGHATASLSGDRHRFSPPGANGGGSGTVARTLLNPDSEAEVLGSKAIVELQAGDVLSIQLAGAGGFGSPTERSRHAINSDIADGYVSLAHAQDVYGFVPPAELTDPDD